MPTVVRTGGHVALPPGREGGMVGAMRARRMWMVGGCALVLSAGCRERPRLAPVADAAPPPLDDDARLDELVRQYLDGTTSASPTTATWLGLHGADDKLDDVSAAAQTREIQRLRRTLEKLEALGEGHLDAAHRLDRTLLDRDARLELYSLTELRPLERSPVRYIDLFASGIYELLDRDFAPLPDRLHDLDGRLSRARFLFDEARRNLKNPPDLLTRRAIDLAQNTRSFVADTLPRVVGAVADERLATDFRTAQGEALRALDDYLNFLSRDLLPRSKGDLAVGKAHLLDHLRWSELVDAAPDVLLAEMQAVGDRELKAAQKRFEEAARQAFPGKSPAEAWRLLDDDHPAAADLRASVAATVGQLQSFTRTRHLLTLPDNAPRVVDMPPYLWGFVRMALPGPFEPQPRDELYVDPVNATWDKKAVDEHLRAFARPQLVLALARQALAHAAAAEDGRRAPTTTQKLTVDEAFAEGFSRYFAQVIVDAGFVAATPGDPHADWKLRLAQRREVLLALCRFVAAIRFHAQGVKLDDLVDVFTDQGSLEDSVARREAERVAADPDVLDEGLGYLVLQKLRADAEREQGDDFVPGAFHDALLAHGQLPLGLLRKRMLAHPDPGLL